MKREITNILNEASRAPSVLNLQPWRFRICGNTIEVYLERSSDLASIDPHGRLQLASCGTLISHLTRAILKREWQPKVDYFPRFEEENLVAYVDIRKQNGNSDKDPATADRYVPESGIVSSVDQLKSELEGIVSRKDVELLIHNDAPDFKVQTHFRENCKKKMDSEAFRQNLNLYLRSGDTEAGISFEDEVLLSDRFFESDKPAASVAPFPEELSNRYLILISGTDNRYEWTRVGEALGDIMIHLKSYDRIGLIALPILTAQDCRAWLKNELNLSGYPQFVLKIQPVKLREHSRKRPLQELFKQRF